MFQSDVPRPPEQKVHHRFEKGTGLLPSGRDLFLKLQNIIRPADAAVADPALPGDTIPPTYCRAEIVLRTGDQTH